MNYNSISSYVYNFFADSLLLAFLFSVYDRNKALTEKQQVEKALSDMNWKQQYSKENIDMINRKCHDLKHQIQMLKNMNASKERDDLIEDLENSIMIFDTNTKTGNNVLDALITEKRLICENNSIEFTMMVDGSILSFIKPGDLYALFGNALDNAIEAEIKEKSEDRFIYFHIFRKNDFIICELNNYCSAQLIIENNSINTSKEDENNHGIGTKSMKFISEKYNGFLSMSCDKDIFNLKIVFPYVE